MSYSQANVGNPIIKKLLDEGVLPQECTKFTLEAAANDVVRLTTEVYVSPEQFQAIADALLSNPEEAKRIARTIIFRPKDDSSQSPVSVDL